MNEPAQNPTPIRVLVVEDNEHAEFLMRLLLERAGYEVTLSANGRDALKKLETMEPAVPVIGVTARTLEMDPVRVRACLSPDREHPILAVQL